MSARFSGFGYRCDCCGRFLNANAPGVSWGRYWSYDMSGFPDLHDTAFRCSPCVDKFGEVGTNCHKPEVYAGRNPKQAETRP